MKQSDLIKDRLRSVILSDKLSSINQLATVLKSDLADILQHYMYIEPSSIEVEIQNTPDGAFSFGINFCTDCIFKFGKLID